MLRRLKRWLRSWTEPSDRSTAISSPELERKLEELEREIAEADSGFEGIPLNRAGDLCVRAGEKGRALEYLGRAIDVYLEDQRPEAARAVAQKLIRVHPRAIRTLCTITWLDLAGGYLGDAFLHLGEYVEASRRGQRQEICRDQIVDMARIMGDDHFRRVAAEGLRDLGFPEDAAMVREWIDKEDAPPGAGSAAELQERCFAAAVGANRGVEDGG